MEPAEPPVNRRLGFEAAPNIIENIPIYRNFKDDRLMPLEVSKEVYVKFDIDSEHPNVAPNSVNESVDDTDSDLQDVPPISINESVKRPTTKTTIGKIAPVAIDASEVTNMRRKSKEEAKRKSWKKGIEFATISASLLIFSWVFLAIPASLAIALALFVHSFAGEAVSNESFGNSGSQASGFDNFYVLSAVFPVLFTSLAKAVVLSVPFL